MNSLNKWLRKANLASLVSSVAFYGALVLVLMSCGAEHSLNSEDLDWRGVTPVVARQVQQQASYEVPRAFIGIVEAPQRTDLAFDASGALVELFVEEGDVVELGQILGQLDVSVVKAELSSARANKRELESRLQLNKRDLLRLRKLREKNYAAESQEDNLTSQRASLVAQVDAAAAFIQSLEQQLKKKTLYAPFDATIASRLVDKGAVVSAGMKVMQLLEAGALEFRVGIPVRTVRNLSIGETYKVLIEGQEYAGRIKSIGSSVDITSKTVAVQLELIDPKASLYDGQIARLILSQERIKEGVWISVDSLISGVRGSWDVYVLSDSLTDGVVPNTLVDLKLIERRKVNVEYVGGNRAYISYGLSSGDRVVDSGVHKLAAGQPVRIAKTVNLVQLAELTQVTK